MKYSAPKMRSLKQLVAIFAFGEGKTEEAFLKYLYSGHRGLGIKITIDNGQGGKPKYLINATLRLTRGKYYDRIFILCDDDNKPCPQNIIKIAKDNNISIFQCTPCIEGFFLILLEPNLDISTLTSKQCKDLFHKKYLDEKQKLKPESYKKIFAPQKLKEMCSKNLLLKDIYNFMMKKNNRF